jgi:bacterioferritin-associated ferredoxin
MLKVVFSWVMLASGENAAMIVCHCRAVSDRILREAVRRGHGSVEAVVEQTGAGTCCGGCLPNVQDIVGAELSGAGSGAAQSGSRPLRLVSNTRAA